MVVKKVKEARFQIQMRDMRFNAPVIMEDIKAFTNQTLTDISGKKAVFFDESRYIHCDFKRC